MHRYHSCTPANPICPGTSRHSAVAYLSHQDRTGKHARGESSASGSPMTHAHRLAAAKRTGEAVPSRLVVFGGYDETGGTQVRSCMWALLLCGPCPGRGGIRSVSCSRTGTATGSIAKPVLERQRHAWSDTACPLAGSQNDTLMLNIEFWRWTAITTTGTRPHRGTATRPVCWAIPCMCSVE